MNYRKYFSDKLEGRGLEIGPLHCPMEKHDRMCVDYVDRLTVAEARKHYPELAEYELIEPTFLDDAETLGTVDNKAYDFVIASHVIEHMRSPLDAIENWCRVLKPDGLLYLVVPDYRKIFDKDRQLTTLDHLVADYGAPDKEADWQHYLEYAEKVDKAADVQAHALDMLGRGYSLHFHTFVPESFMGMLNWFSQHIRPLEVAGGWVRNPDDHEFHVLARRL